MAGLRQRRRRHPILTPDPDRPENVARLRVAWTYRTGETSATPGPWAALRLRGHAAHGGRHALPQHAVQPRDRPRRRNREGTLGLGREGRSHPARRDRHVAGRLHVARYGLAQPISACRRRIFVGTSTPGSSPSTRNRRAVRRLRARRHGRPHGGNRRPDDSGCYQVTSPPASSTALIVVGSTIGDNLATEDRARGIVRAYDARSGALRWTWDPIPTRESDPARATWAATAGVARARRTSGR